MKKEQTALAILVAFMFTLLQQLQWDFLKKQKNKKHQPKKYHQKNVFKS